MRAFLKKKVSLVESNIVTRGNTYHFNITSRLRLIDAIALNTQSGHFARRIYDWIQLDPRLLWETIHIGKVNLTRDAYAELKNRMKTLYPELVRANEVKKEAILKLKRGKRKLKRLESSDDK